MKENYQKELKEYLVDDETLLWTAKPKSGIIFRENDKGVIAFGIVWTAFGLFISWGGIYSNAPTVPLLIGMFFWVIGLQLAIGRFFSDSMQRENTYYGLTEHRILIKSGILFKKIKSVYIKTLLEIELTESSDGLGTIYINSNSEDKNKGNIIYLMNSMLFVLDATFTSDLELIEHPRKVYNQILKIQNKKIGGTI